jgi:SAM-dependent methyltransferase
MVSSDERRTFLDERRAITTERYDRLHSPRYDENWGAVLPTHRAFVDRLLAETSSKGLVVDVACGTGKYWPQILAAGHRILGIDQSAGMLATARAKHPQVPTRLIAMQELIDQPDLVGISDAMLCVDALENVGPEDWPTVVHGLSSLLRMAAPAYITVELPELPFPDPVDPRQIPGEMVGEGYHYYPSRTQVRQWLTDSRLMIVEEADADHYWHLFLRQTRPVEIDPATGAYVGPNPARTAL